LIEQKDSGFVPLNASQILDPMLLCVRVPDMITHKLVEPISSDVVVS
jgi:hypothetical protein